MNTSLVIIGVVSAVAVALVSAIAVVHRCRRRRAEPHAECVESSAEMGSARCSGKAAGQQTSSQFKELER